VLHGDTRVSTVELNVADLDAQRAFSGDVLGLEVLEETDDAVSLGPADEELVRLVRTSDALPAQSDAGL
jgi:catechol-2,3-dioxygenase